MDAEFGFHRSIGTRKINSYRSSRYRLPDRGQGRGSQVTVRYLFGVWNLENVWPDGWQWAPFLRVLQKRSVSIANARLAQWC